MKFACPESQKRVLLKCGNIASGSAAASSGGLAGFSALAPGLLPLFGGDASGCCAFASMTPGTVARTNIRISHTAASSVAEVQRIDLQFRFPISLVSPIHQYARHPLRERYSSRRVGHDCTNLFRVYYRGVYYQGN